MIRTWKRLLCLLLALAMVSAFAVPVNAKEAETVEVNYQRYNADNGKYVGDTADCVPITGSSTALSTGWYVVLDEVTVAGRIQISGTVNLILADGAELTAEKGIDVAGENALNIFAQAQGSGQLIAEGQEFAAGIGGDFMMKGGSITIHGGNITVTGGNLAAGIGGGCFEDGGEVTIHGGTVTATGGMNGAGIGGGCGDAEGTGFGGSITINGGTVTATGQEGASGLGGGVYGCGGSVTINGGNVTAISIVAAEGFGIGAGDCVGSVAGKHGTLTVGEGVIVSGGDDADSQEVLEAPFENRSPYMTAIFQEPPATAEADYLEYDLTTKEFDEKTAECLVIDEDSTALSDGWYVVQDEVTIAERIEIDGDVNLILADGAKLNASQGVHVTGNNSLTVYGQAEGSGELLADTSSNFAAIGGDSGEANGTVTIHGGTVTANGQYMAAGIGGGNGGDGGIVTIYGGTVTATSLYNGAGIGGGNMCSGGQITIYGGTVTGLGKVYGAGIGGGYFGSSGSIVIYDGVVTGTNESNGAGIGGGSWGGADVTIYGGTVTGNGGTNSAGIGGGQYGGGTVTIYDGTVYAYAVSRGAAIGTGAEYSKSDSTVTIYDGTVQAIHTGEAGAGIGGGVKSPGCTVTIHGGKVDAIGGAYSAGIGSAVYSSGGYVIIDGGEITASGGEGGAGIGAGRGESIDNVSITGGKVVAIGGSGAYGIGNYPPFPQVGTLTVGADLVVRGGEDADSLVVIEDIDNTRYPYMTVKIDPVPSFVWSWEGDVPTVTLKLTWPDGTVDTIRMDTDVSDSNGTITYTASAEVDGTVYTTEKTVERTYSVQVTNGTITAGEKDGYSYGDTINLTANPAPDGQVFAGWYMNDELVSTSEVYGRVVDQDLVLEARYDEAPLPVEPVVTASDTWRTAAANGTTYKTTLSVNWSVPSVCKLVEAGVIRAFAKSTPSQDTLVSKGTKKATTLKTANGTYKLTISVSGSTNLYNLYYVGYVVYKDADGNTQTKYSEIGCNVSPIAIS